MPDVLVRVRISFLYGWAKWRNVSRRKSTVQPDNIIRVRPGHSGTLDQRRIVAIKSMWPMQTALVESWSSTHPLIKRQIMGNVRQNSTMLSGIGSVTYYQH
ncbi:hypothetical protein CIHG_05945 [Coccidioides immitis H538.4]|uniref:Uncharacterized protein n=3 Tax=Coccidioides immitis TaxID=5501 RepID=A0A0J8TRT9_COCIT|nr:hypothetical protein CIRG_01699 [Coccidioides immitis RMSCC 2394]KMU76467.1 hypothetical protein CISG_01199 [Coccidioides immitis RMSCC 3703]KMU87551.1 hypothetical protein CIHG_05945 [Coccidioides immitis H538.4]